VSAIPAEPGNEADASDVTGVFAVETAEGQRLAEEFPPGQGWKKWGPYLSERQWGTVREDYSADGSAWEYFPHEHARSRAYRWGEDGIAGCCDRTQTLCLALALWNERDPILKERLFGLTNSQGNHGEDVKELYYYLDATPTHSYLRMLYKYPQGEFPYAGLIEENRQRGVKKPEYELLDTGLFDGDRYFDVFVEYAQAAPEDILMRITAVNRGTEAAPLHILPQLWFRNTWSWQEHSPRPRLWHADENEVFAEHAELGTYRLYVDGEPELLFTDNDTNVRRLNGIEKPGWCKDGFHERVIGGEQGAVNPARTGTKFAAWHRFSVPAQGSVEVRLRLCRQPVSLPFRDFAAILEQRKAEADSFYARVQSGLEDADARAVQRQAFAGLIWSKQFYYYDVPQWLQGDPAQPPPPTSRRQGRNWEWQHLNNADVISMPDKWEYPWYAAWDLAFHMLPFALIDPGFAKRQLVLLTREWYMHPNGQMPAYEWAFGDVNPPVHAWAAWRVFQIDRVQRGGRGDLQFLERVFHKLLLNFTWWVNRKDTEGRNVFQGGFLGLDNIGVFDRSKALPTGGHIDQSDGTSWMAMYSLNMLRIALELARHNSVYEDIATKFFEHFLHIAEAMTSMGGAKLGLWDDEDKFFYDVLHLPNGKSQRLKIRSMVGLIPLFAVETIDAETLRELPGFRPAAAVVSELPPGSGRSGVALGCGWHGRATPAVTVAWPAHEASAQTHARRDRVSVRVRRACAVASSRRASLRVQGQRRPAGGGLPAGRVGHRPVRRQLQLARTDLVSGQLPDHRVAAEIPLLLRRRLQSGVPDRFRHLHDHQGGVRGTDAPAGADFPQGMRTANARCMAKMHACRTIRTFAIICCSTSIFTAIRVVAWVHPIRPAGPP
jgi:hypothetical protein